MSMKDTYQYLSIYHSGSSSTQVYLFVITHSSVLLAPVNSAKMKQSSSAGSVMNESRSFRDRYTLRDILVC